jgi:hypothetical protein
MPSSILGGSSIQLAVLILYSYRTSIQHLYHTSIQHTRTHTALDHLQNAPPEVEAHRSHEQRGT